MHILFRELIDSVELAKGAPQTVNGLHTVGTYRFQNQRITKHAGTPQSSTVTPWLSHPQLFIAILSVFATEICTAAFYSAVSVNFSHQIINGLRYGHAEFSSVFLPILKPIGSLVGDRLD